MSEPINRTPAHLRCTMTMSCPSVYEIEGDKLLIVGAAAHMGHISMLVDDGKYGPDEHAIVIDRSLLGDLIQAPAATDKPSGDHPVSEFKSKAREVVCGWGISDAVAMGLAADIVTALAEAAGESAAIRHDLERSIARETEHVNRIEELEARLEMDHVFEVAADGETMVRVEIPPEDRSFLLDGIECRDGTIALQDECIKRSQARIAELEKALKPFEDSAKRLGLDILHFDEWPNHAQVALRVTAEDVRRAFLVSAQGEGDRTASVSDQRELET